MAQHKWHKEIKAWADGAEIEARNYSLDEACSTWNEWTVCEVPAWWENCWEFRIKTQYKEEPYWLCCGCKDPRHNKSCSEAKMGHPERCKFGTASEHFKPQPKEPQYLYVYKGGIGHEPIFCFARSGDRLVEQNYIGKIKLEVDD